MWGIVSIILWASTITGYVIRNLLIKNQRLEALVIERDILISNVMTLVAESDKRIKELDTLGAFKSDDEVGHFFTTVKEIQNSFNLYFQNQN